ncbi:MAG: enoyl-CoA hydratase/isomerase family protein [bacterium]|nr:enoyl-CoA hydratase/isomerase family protein [bacterium]
MNERLQNGERETIGAAEALQNGKASYAADLRVARKGSGKCGLPEVALGVLPGTGGTQRLARNVGRSRAIELLASGRTFDYDEAERLGLVDRQIEADDDAAFLESVLEWGLSFCTPERAALSVGLIKQRPRDAARGRTDARARAPGTAVLVQRRQGGRRRVPREARAPIRGTLSR